MQPPFTALQTGVFLGVFAQCEGYSNQEVQGGSVRGFL